MKRISIFIILSLVLHILLNYSLWQISSILTQNLNKKNITEIELQETSDKNRPRLREKQIIKQLQAQEPETLNPKDQARFDSEKTHRVQHETKARETGLTQNSVKQQPSVHQTQKIQSQNPQPTENKNHEKEKDGDLPEFARMNPQSSPQASARASSLSTILPNDVQFSDATNLNTDANTYATFYSRVEDLFYVRWSEKLTQIWDRLDYSFKKNYLAGRTWSTQIEVWLKANGEFHSAYIHKESGYKPFDEATVFAFKDARFFPNPPRAKVESDGFVRLRYRFNVQIGQLP